MKTYYIVHKYGKKITAYTLDFAKSIAGNRWEIEEVVKEDKPRLSESARAEIRADLEGAPMDALVSACNSVKPREWR